MDDLDNMDDIHMESGKFPIPARETQTYSYTWSKSRRAVTRLSRA